MDNKTKLTNADLVPLGIGIAIGAGLLVLLIELWPIIIFTGAIYCVNRGLPDFKEKISSKDLK